MKTIKMPVIALAGLTLILTGVLSAKVLAQNEAQQPAPPQDQQVQAPADTQQVNQQAAPMTDAPPANQPAQPPADTAPANQQPAPADTPVAAQNQPAQQPAQHEHMDRPAQQQGENAQAQQQPSLQPISYDKMQRGELAYPTGDTDTSSILVTKYMPEQVRVGQAFRADIQVKNLTDQPLAGVTVAENSGNRLEVQASDPQVQQDEQGVLRWTLGELHPNETRTIRIAAIPRQMGSIAACLSASFVPALCTTLNVVNPVIEISKAGPESAYSCDEIVYRYTVTNRGTGVATDVVVTDTLPAGLAPSDDKNTITQHLGDIPAGESKTFEGRVRPAKAGNYTTRAVARSGPDEAYSAPVITRIVEPKLVLQILAPEWQYVGQPVTFTIDVTNTGDVLARNARLDINAPGLDDDDSLRNLGDIQPGKTVRTNVTVRSDQAKALTVTAAANSLCAAEVEQIAKTEFRTIPALRLETVDNRDPIPVGEEAVYTVNVKSQGSAPASNVKLTAKLPPQQQFVEATGPTKVHAEGDTLVFDPVQSLPPGEVAAWVVRTKAMQPGDVQFRVEMVSDTFPQPSAEVKPTRLVAPRPATAQGEQPADAIDAPQSQSATR